MKHAIWFDITTIYAWTTTAVGIVRMEMECAQYALHYQPQITCFCRLDRRLGYLAVSHEEVAMILMRLKNQVAPKHFASPLSELPLTRMRLWKRRINRIIHFLPADMAETIWRFGVSRKQAVLALYRASQEVRLAFREVLHPNILRPADLAAPNLLASHSLKPTPFGKEDVYISMGLDWEHKDMPHYLFSQKRKIGFKVVLFCYDIIPIRLPHLCVGNVAAAFAKYFADVAWCADEIFCISDFSKNDLRQFLESIGAPEPSMQVVRLGCDLVNEVEFSSDQSIAELANIPYLLFVSTIERRKNHEVLYRAYLHLIDEGMTDLPKLVFVGKLGWGVQDFLADLKFDPRIAKYVQILHHVTDAQLAFLYRRAYFTLFPSLYEGWGLPVAESLSIGKFCLASQSSSIPEVGGELIEYLDPWDASEWAARIAYYIDHPEELQKREAQIAQLYKPVTWEMAGEQVFSRVKALL